MNSREMIAAVVMTYLSEEAVRGVAFGSRMLLLARVTGGSLGPAVIKDQAVVVAAVWSATLGVSGRWKS
jgi:hypothetical protein